MTLGASDEKANYFTQKSEGYKYGVYYTSSNPMIIRCFGDTTKTCLGTSTYNEPMPDDTNLAWYNPIADPAAFYVNKAVTEGTCTGGSNAGDMCSASSDCASGTCTAAAISNISRMMAAEIFTGQVQNWQDFGAGFANLDVWACMRHTGAGTNITFDYAVLGDGHSWLPNGTANMANQDSSIVGSPPNIWFYDTITAQLACVNGEVSSGTYNSTGSAIGSIGYTDADRSTSIGSGTSLPNVVMVNYNGIQPSRRNVRNGLYDFWSKNYLYYNPSVTANAPPTSSGAGGTNFTVFDAMATYASNPTKITNLTTGKGNFWAAMGPGSTTNVSGFNNTGYVIPSGEMWYMKSGANILPGPTTATNPQNP